MEENQFDFSKASDEYILESIKFFSRVAREWLDLFNGINDNSFLGFSFMSKAVRVEQLQESYSDLPNEFFVRRNDVIKEFYQKMCECTVYERSVLENEYQKRIEARRLN